MKSFVEYLVGNWEVVGCVSIEKKFSHMRKVGMDKKTELERINHCITVGLRFFDKDNKLLNSESVKFVNNLICKASEKRLINISGDELNNRFMGAKGEIIGIIRCGYIEKMNELKSKLDDVTDYGDGDIVGINKEFKGEHIEIGGKVRVKKK